MRTEIYYINKQIILSDVVDDELARLKQHPEVVWIDEVSTRAIHALMHEIKKNDIHTGVLISDNFEQLRSNFFSHFNIIKAGGGLVENPEGKFLFIFRRGFWDLPKGKLDAHETIEECAHREIREETGIGELTMIKKIGTTYHLYDEFGKHILKETVWFHFKSNKIEHLIPQTEEDITKAEWVDKNRISELKSKTYATIRNLLSTFFN